MLKETYDPVEGTTYPCWNTVNTPNTPEKPEEAEACLYDIKAQGLQTKIITDFIDAVDSGKLTMLMPKHGSEYAFEDKDAVETSILPYIQTDFLFEEIANLKLKVLSNGNLTVEKSAKKMNKDRWSALAYGIFYIMEFQNNIEYTEQSDLDIISQYTIL